MNKTHLKFQILSIILLIFVTLGGISHIVHSSSQSVEAADTSSLSYISVTVSANDSLWSIAKKYHTKECGTIKNYVKEIKRCNALTSDSIYAGNHLVVPIYIDNSSDTSASQDDAETLYCFSTM